MGAREIRLSRIQQAWIYVSFALLFGSGAVWIYVQYIAETVAASPFSESATSPFATLYLKIHGAAAMLFLIVLGSLIPGHMRGGWLARKNIRTGVPMVLLNLLLIGTAWALYYTGGEELRAWASRIHIAVGLVFLPLLIWHVYKHPQT